MKKALNFLASYVFHQFFKTFLALYTFEIDRRGAEKNQREQWKKKDLRYFIKKKLLPSEKQHLSSLRLRASAVNALLQPLQT
jgi:hypothetical protein